MKSNKEKKTGKKKLKIRLLSSDASIYKTSATIILKGKPSNKVESKEKKFLEFLSRAPISFGRDES